MSDIENIKRAMNASKARRSSATPTVSDAESTDTDPETDADSGSGDSDGGDTGRSAPATSSGTNGTADVVYYCKLCEQFESDDASNVKRHISRSRDKTHKRSKGEWSLIGQRTPGADADDDTDADTADDDETVDRRAGLHSYTGPATGVDTTSGRAVQTIQDRPVKSTSPPPEDRDYTLAVEAEAEADADAEPEAAAEASAGERQAPARGGVLGDAELPPVTVQLDHDTMFALLRTAEAGAAAELYRRAVLGDRDDDGSDGDE